MDQKTAEKLRKEYPHYIPLEEASKYLGVAPRQLSWLIAEGRKPFSSFGANIGRNQRYIRIYTEPFIAYMTGNLADV